MNAAYLELDPARLRRRAVAALARLACCDICPRECGVDRLRDERNACHVGRWAVVSSMGPHFGEEAPLVGTHGSGTLFLAGCNLSCRFCQNAPISQLCHGDAMDADTLARTMLALQEMGCHNLNLVTPTHVPVMYSTMYSTHRPSRSSEAAAQICAPSNSSLSGSHGHPVRWTPRRCCPGG